MNRNTVVEAMKALAAEGVLVGEPGRGTFVAARPGPGPEARPATTPGFDLPSRLVPITTSTPGALNLAEGSADGRLAPAQELGKAYQRAMRRHGRELLRSGEPEGNLLLREAFSQWISERHGVRVPPGQILVTGGSRSALLLACSALLEPGARVGVENPGNPAAWRLMAQVRGLELSPLEMDGEGVIPGALDGEGPPLRHLHLAPRRQVPTGASMSPERAQGLLEWAARNRVSILEEDGEGEIRFDERNPLPMFARDRTGQVLFTSSFSRILAPGVRLGFLVAPASLMAPLARVRRDLEWQGDRALEWALADLMRDGVVARHLRRVCPIYRDRRDRMAELLRKALGGAVAFELPEGGLSLWLRVAPDLDAEAWTVRARERGLVLHPPGHHFLGAPGPFLRIGFGQADDGEIAEAVRRLAEARPIAGPGSGPREGHGR